MAKNKKKSNQRNRNEKTGSNPKVVVTTEKKKKITPTSSSRTAATSREEVEMLFGKENFILIAVGALLVVIGLFLMSGGAQDPNEWNAEEVYSARRTVIAPLFILAGLITELVAIFKKKSVA